MEIRKIAAGERYTACEISTVAFHGRISDPEKAKENAEKQTCEDWGAFDADGRMAAHIINNKFVSFLDGKRIINGGIGAVSTLPEYREDGCIRRIFESLLPEARANGEVISTLYPFNHSFYRKVGYETICATAEYEIPTGALRPGYKCAGKVRRATSEDAPAFLDIYSRFSRQFNFAIERTEESYAKRFDNCSLSSGNFAYLLDDAYLFVNDGGSLLKVTDCAWASPAGFREILGFLSRFTADYSTISILLPQGVELLSIIHSPAAYDIKKKQQSGYMCRVINTEKLLLAMKRPAGCRFTISVTDGLLPENSGTWRVTEECVTPSDLTPDIAVDIRALAQLATGAVSLAEAALRSDVTISANEDILSRVFVRKPLYVGDHF